MCRVMACLGYKVLCGMEELHANCRASALHFPDASNFHNI